MTALRKSHSVLRPRAKACNWGETSGDCGSPDGRLLPGDKVPRAGWGFAGPVTDLFGGLKGRPKMPNGDGFPSSKPAGRAVCPNGGRRSVFPLGFGG